MNIQIKKEQSKYQRMVKIKPKGFWTDMVTVYQSKALGKDKWEQPSMSWASGGQDGTLSTSDCIKNFIRALSYGRNILNKWLDKEP